VAEQRVTRRLTTILAADVVGYSRLTGVDEEGTVSRLRALRQEPIDPVIAANGGGTVKLMGDGRLVEFSSVVDAVRCAIELQNKMTARNIDVAPDKRIEFRVGIHLGDVMVESDGDLMGDGVNIAARLEGIAEPGGICLSTAAYEQVRDKLHEQFIDLGDKELKNIARPVRVYRIDIKAASTNAAPEVTKSALALPDKPSIAVLPFQNMSGDLEQEYFSDGMVEDIITGLSRMHWLFVIARNSSFAYKGKSPDIRGVGRELGVRYVLEGSVRKAGGRVRITGQLIDAASGAHIWADRFEGGLEDIFDLQDRFTSSVVGAIEPALRAAEMKRAQAKPTESLNAYDYFLRAQAQPYNATRTANKDALDFCLKAIAIDPRYASPYGLAAYCVAGSITSGWVSDAENARNEVIALALKAIEFGANDPTALWMAGWALDLAPHDYDRALAAIGRSLSLDPNSAMAWNFSGWVHWHCGDGNTAIDHIQRAIRLSPHEPLAYIFKGGIGWAHFVEGRYEEAIKWADMAIHDEPRWTTPHRCKASAYGLLGRLEEARAALRMLLPLQPDATIAKLRSLMPLKRAEHMAAYLEGLREAGLPE
jgi:adenylate cyclase